MAGKPQILIPRKEIYSMIDRISDEIMAYRKNDSLYIITVLKGGRTFANHVIWDIQRKYPGIRIFDDEVRLSSYGDSTVTSREVKFGKDLRGNPEGKDVIVLDDIIDTGITLDVFRDHLLTVKKANSVEIGCLVSKLARRERDVYVKYLGREIENVFIIGFGIDRGGKTEAADRRLKDIWRIPQ